MIDERGVRLRDKIYWSLVIIIMWPIVLNDPQYKTKKEIGFKKFMHAIWTNGEII